MNRIYLAIFGLATFNVSANNPINLCEVEAMAAQSFESIQGIQSPSTTSENEQSIVFDWTGDSLVVVLADGSRASAIARCVYSKNEDRVIFLNIYCENVVSNYPVEIRSLQSATKQESHTTAINLGLTEQQVRYLDWHGTGCAKLGYYNPDGSIDGIAKLSKSDLEHLDRLHIINLYSVSLIVNNKNDDEHYFLIGTAISELLGDKL